jgi:hypothetical protein
VPAAGEPTSIEAGTVALASVPVLIEAATRVAPANPDQIHKKVHPTPTGRTVSFD